MSNREENVAILKGMDGQEVALKGVNVKGRIFGLMASVEVEQSYLNSEPANIEAVYTFPLPIGSVLLALEVEIAGKTLVGTVVEKKKAERDYEDAITDGNSAVMLEEAGPGLYTASLGNLMAKESAVIRYRYALPLYWQNNHLRFLLPTTIAPRYGNAEAAGLRSHQVPSSSLAVEYPLNLSVSVEGELASSTIGCISHPISMSRTENGVVINLPSSAVLDRDFILTIESPTAQSVCVATPDFEGHVVMASLRIPPVHEAESQPISLKVVIDCSGSMGGTSIQQARKAALEILNQLRPSDKFNVTLFGSKFQHIFKGMVSASSKNITEAWSRLVGLDADMGGTEMESALESVFSLGEVEGQAALLLITDGEIHEHEKLVKRAGSSRHRVFVVGVGTSVAEVFLRALANTTGGACELVAPQEGMAERVLSQFHRIRQPKLGQLAVEWPAIPTWETELPQTVFAGDTVHVFAGFPSEVSGTVKLSATGNNGVSAPITSREDIDLPRVAAAIRLKSMPELHAIELALNYQLLTKWTNFLVVAEREVKAADLPNLHQLPQMLAAGWGGMGRIDSGIKKCVVAYCAPVACRAVGGNFNDFDDDIPFGSDPEPKSSAASGASPSTKKRVGNTSPRQFLERLEAAVFLYATRPTVPETLAQLDALGLDKLVSDEIRKLVTSGYNEVGLVIAFLQALAESAIGDLFERNLKRLILKRWKDVRPGELFVQEMKKAVKEITADAWGLEVTDDAF